MDPLTLLAVAFVAGGAAAFGVWCALRFERKQQQRTTIHRVEIVMPTTMQNMDRHQVAKAIRSELESMGRRGASRSS